MVLSGEKASFDLKKELSDEFSQLAVNPTLLIVEVGERNENKIYKRNIMKLAKEFGVNTKNLTLNNNVSSEEFKQVLFNSLEDVDGVIIERPLPLELEAIVDDIPPELDIEGLSAKNLGNLALAPALSIAPPTPQAALFILDYYGISVTGKHCLVIGRSKAVGFPLASMLIQKGRDATVTVAHSKTPFLKSYTKNADIIFVSAGMPGLIKEEMVERDTVIVDIGVNVLQTENGKRVVGDVDFYPVLRKGCSVTPVPGGVGELTTLFLMKNLLKNYKE